jgi:indoleamine 2,3-dioxygenase
MKDFLMRHDCWHVSMDRGFLMTPDPLISTKQAFDGILPSDALDHIHGLAADLPALLVSGRAHAALEKLPIYDFSALAPLLDDVHFAAVERLNQIYCYFASACIHADINQPANCIPAGVAVPLVQLARFVERPPILAYSGYVLGNWQRPAPHAPIDVDDLKLIQNFLGNRDERWFILIHVDIEARAAAALFHLKNATQSASRNQPHQLEAALEGIHASLKAMITSFHRMPEACDSNVYYYKVRPYIFGFDDVIYEGVAEFDNQPVSFRGQTGAQSSIIPALVAAFGLNHEQNGLTQHLDIMHGYMPKPHRQFIESMRDSSIRSCVMAHPDEASLTEAYNECLRAMVEFRSLHYRFATEYIFQKVRDPRGTGGTVFMDWLKQLTLETDAQLV